MGRTSLKAVAKYNQKTYATVSVRLPKETVKTFKEKCKEKNISQAKIILEAIKNFLDE